MVVSGEYNSSHEITPLCWQKQFVRYVYATTQTVQVVRISRLGPRCPQSLDLYTTCYVDYFDAWMLVLPLDFCGFLLKGLDPHPRALEAPHFGHVIFPGSPYLLIFRRRHACLGKPQRTRIQSSDLHLPSEVWGQETVANPIRSEVEWDTKSSNLNSFSTVGYEVYWERWNSRPPRAHPKTTPTPPESNPKPTQEWLVRSNRPQRTIT